MEEVLVLMFWPFCCAVTMAITVPVVRRRQRQDPDYDPQVFVFSTLVAVTGAFAYLKWGRGEAPAESG